MIETYRALSERIRRGPSPHDIRLVAVDGLGGSGKSTFARRLARTLGDAALVPTDDFASWDAPLDWWPRLLREVIRPLSRGTAARYQRYDWGNEQLAEWIDVPIAPVVVIEGVTAARREWANDLAFAIWVEAPRATRLARGLERDGAAALTMWERWMAEEDAYVARDPVRFRVDLTVDGAPSVRHRPSHEYVTLA